MPEPTRQQIKEAFKKTIERWEKIVEDVEYYYNSHCDLCYLTTKDHYCHLSCPIRDYVDTSGCDNTPFTDFYLNKTLPNALAELNFLRKVYIWWMEKEEEGGTFHTRGIAKEEKKEEWEDITEEMSWKVNDIGDFYYLGGYYKGERVVNADISGIWIPFFPGDESFKIEIDKHDRHFPRRNFRILKKI